MRKLFIFAYQDEMPYSKYNFLLTGIGRVKAAYSLTKILTFRRPDLIINVGVAGSSKKYNIGSVIVANKSFSIESEDSVYQPKPHECILSSFYNKKIAKIFRENKILFKLDAVGSSEKFIHFKNYKKIKNLPDVIDMELSAFVEVANNFNIPIVSVKVVSDNYDKKHKFNLNSEIIKNILGVLENDLIIK
ncbi:MAG: hypothetical protein ACRDCG_02720 [Mycoplasmoidaceae bacterium]